MNKGCGPKQAHTLRMVIGLMHIVIASLWSRCGHPVFPVAAFLDCFAGRVMTKVLRKFWVKEYTSFFLKSSQKYIEYNVSLPSSGPYPSSRLIFRVLF